MSNVKKKNIKPSKYQDYVDILKVTEDIRAMLKVKDKKYFPNKDDIEFTNIILKNLYNIEQYYYTIDRIDSHIKKTKIGYEEIEPKFLLETYKYIENLCGCKIY